MKKVVYLAPIFLLSFLGKGALANQVEHVSKLDEALKEETIAKPNIAAQNAAIKQTPANQKIGTNLLNTQPNNNSMATINAYTASKIDAADQTQTKNEIVNPAGNKVHVNWVDTNGKNISNTNNGYDIDLTKVKAQDSYRWVPKGYSLQDPDSTYSVKPNMERVDRVGSLEINSGGAVDDHYSITDNLPITGIDSAQMGLSTDNIEIDGDMDIEGTHGHKTVRIDSVNVKDLPMEVAAKIDKSAVASYVKQAIEKYLSDDPERADFIDSGFSFHLKTRHADSDQQIQDGYIFSDPSSNVYSINSNTVNVILQHQTQTIDVNSTQLGNNATNNVFEINGDNKKQVSAQVRNFKSTGLLDLLTNAIQIPSNWQAATNPNFDKVTLTNPVGYDALNSKLLVLNL